MTTRFCIVDVESKSPVPIARGAANYFAAPDARLICVAYKLPGAEVKSVWLDSECNTEQHIAFMLPDELLHFDGEFVAHNWFFEYSAFKRFLPHSRLARPDVWWCTQAMSRRFGIAAPKSALEHVAAKLKTPVQKGRDGKRLIDMYSIPDKKTGQFRAIPSHDVTAWLKYCEADVAAEAAVFDILWPHFEDSERAVFRADCLQQARGVPVDVKSAKKLIAISDNFRTKAEREAEQIAGRNEAGTLILTSNSEFLDFLRARFNVNLPNAQAGTIANFLCANKVSDDLLRIFELRSVLMSRAADKAEKLLEMTSADGRCYNPSVYAGAHTGRWQSWGVNFFNFYKFAAPSEKWAAVLKEQTKSPTRVGIASLQRGLICAPKNRVLITSDWRGIENYLALYYSGDDEQRVAVERGESQYVIFGEKLFGRKISKHDTPAEYNLAKIAVLSLGYGAGAEKFASIVKMQGIELSPAEAKKIVTTWRTANKKIVDAWWQAERGFRASFVGQPYHFAGIKFEPAVNDVVKIVLPNGYALRYPHVFDTRDGLVWSADDGATFEKLYGGEIWENIIQAIAAQLLRRALVALENKGVPVVLHVYDEIVCECDRKAAKKTARVVAAVMRSAPAWAPDLRLEVEQKIATRWGK